jgi:predicted Rossmann fold flavoprotein
MNIISTPRHFRQLPKTYENIKDLSGVRSDVEISLIENDNYIKKEVGEILFTDYGISGICSMQISSFIAHGLDDNKQEKVSINFIPSIAKNKDDFINFINIEKSLFNDRKISEVLDSFLNYKISNFILKMYRIDGNKYWDYLTDIEKDNIISSLVSFELNITGTNSFDNSQVCSGGVSLDEIDLNTMESKVIPNLYIVGELLDLNGDCGGYNITFASITGMLAGIGVCNND